MKPNYWLAEWFCPVCMVMVRKHHRSRHTESKMHRRLAAHAERGRSSDRQFTMFLASVDPRKFKGYEAKLYSKIVGSLKSRK